MILIGIKDSLELSCIKEIMKIKALQLLENIYEIGMFQGLSHKYLFEGIYEFAGKMKISKGNFCFAAVIYLSSAQDSIDQMPQ